jgi:hypothetical protein
MEYQTIMKLHKISITINTQIKEHIHKVFYIFKFCFSIYLKIYKRNQVIPTHSKSCQ